MHVGAEKSDELAHVVDVVVDMELALFQRHHARVDPVGDVHVVVRQHGAHRVAQQRGKVPRQRRHQQHLGLRGDARQRGLGLATLLASRLFAGHAFEPQQVAERLLDDDAFFDAHGLAVDDGAGQPERRLLVALRQAMKQFRAGGDAPAGRKVGKGTERIAEQFEAGTCQMVPGRKRRVLKLVQGIPHQCLIQK